MSSVWNAEVLSWQCDPCDVPGYANTPTREVEKEQGQGTAGWTWESVDPLSFRRDDAKSTATKVAECEASYAKACVVLGLYVVAVNIFNLLIVFGQTQNVPRGYRVDTVGIQSMTIYFVIWAVLGFVLMSGVRWLIWVLFVFSTFRFVGAAAFLLGMGAQHDQYAPLRMIAEGVLAGLCVWCIHWMQLVAKARRSMKPPP